MSKSADADLLFVPLQRPGRVADLSSQVPDSGGTSDGVFVVESSVPWAQFWLDPRTLKSTFFPLVLFGPAGSGKTSLAVHLLASLERGGNFGDTSDSGRPFPVFCTAVDFARRVSGGDGDRLAADPLNTFLHASSVLIDDCLQLRHYPSAQLPFANLVDKLAAREIPLVVTASLPPAAWTGFSDQLISRLAMGLSLPVCFPGLLARRWILEQSFDRAGVRVNANALSAIADRCRWSYSRLMRLSADIALALRCAADRLAVTPVLNLADIERLGCLPARGTVNFLALICAAVAKEFGVSLAGLRGPSRRHALVLARDVAVYLCKSLLDCSLSAIGRYLGGRDHSTIGHALAKIDAILRTDLELYPLVNRLSLQLAASLDSFDRFEMVGDPSNSLGVTCSQSV